MKNNFVAIFLDNDGILVDTEKFFAEACDEISRDLFKLPFSLEMYQKYGYTKGIGIQGWLREQNIAENDIQAFRKIRNQSYVEKLSQDIKPLPGVVAFLELKSREKIPMACVTATLLPHFLQVHNKTGILPYLDFWITNEDITKSKPSPEGYLLAAEKMKVDPKNCLAIEDSPRGIMAGKKAGMTVYTIPTEQTKDLDLSLADEKFAGFSDLIEFLQK